MGFDLGMLIQPLNSTLLSIAVPLSLRPDSDHRYECAS